MLIISDEIWADVMFSGAKHVPIVSLSEETAARTVTAGAASKAFNLAGLRCAVAHIGPEDMEKQICELPGHLLGGVSAPEATYLAWQDLRAYDELGDNPAAWLLENAKVVLGAGRTSRARGGVRAGVLCDHEECAGGDGGEVGAGAGVGVMRGL